MFTLSSTEAVVLGVGVLATIVLVVGAALRGVPRSSHVVTTTVRCPLINRTVTADVEWDQWAVRFIDVARCTVLGPCARTSCSRRCVRPLNRTAA